MTETAMKQLRLPIFEGKQPERADFKVSGEVRLTSFDQDALHYGQTVIVVAKVRVKSVSHEMVRVTSDYDAFTRRHKGDIVGAYRIDAPDLDGFTPAEAEKLWEAASIESHRVEQRRRDDWTGQRSMDGLIEEASKVGDLVDAMVPEGIDSVTLSTDTTSVTLGRDDDGNVRKVDPETGEITEG